MNLDRPNQIKGYLFRRVPYKENSILEVFKRLLSKEKQRFNGVPNLWYCQLKGQSVRLKV